MELKFILISISLIVLVLVVFVLNINLDLQTEKIKTGVYPITDHQWACEQRGGTWDEKIGECAPMRSFSCEELGGEIIKCAPCATQGVCADVCITGCKLSPEQVSSLN